MKSIGSLIFFLALVSVIQGIRYKERGLNDWSINNIGDVKFLHYYYEDHTLKGIFAATHQGTLALINPKTGGLLWRKTLTQNRSIDSAIFKDNYALVTVEGNSSAEVWQMSTGKLLGTFDLRYNPKKAKFFDSMFLGKQGDNKLSFALMTNQWLRIYKDSKEVQSLQALDNQTFVTCFYESLYDKISLALTYPGSNELTVYSFDSKKNALTLTSSFLFSQYDYELKKTTGHIVAVHTNIRNTITFYSIVDSEALIDQLKHKIHSFYEPTEMIVTEDTSNYFVNAIKRRQLMPVITLSKAEGEYAFGASLDEKKLVFTVSNPGSLALYKSVGGSSPALSANFTKDLLREHYGTPEKVWVDSESDAVVIKTADKSLHLVKGKEKVWTRQEGLTAVKKWVVAKGQEVVGADKVDESSMNPIATFVKRIGDQANAAIKGAKKVVKNVNALLTQKLLPLKPKKRIDGKYLIGLTKHSKIYALNSADGSIVWQRMGKGKISNLYHFSTKIEDTLVVITHTDNKKTIIQELHPSNGTLKNETMTINNEIIKSIPITSKVLPKTGKLLLLIDKEDKAYVYPDTVGSKLTAGVVMQRLTMCHVGQSRSLLTGYRINPRTMKGAEVWRINFEKTGEEIIGYASDDQLSPDQYQPMKENNGNILYKYVDPNLIAVATFAHPNHLNVYVMNRANGTIIYAGHVYNVNGKEGITISFVENTIVVKYLKKYSERTTTLLNEVLLIEMYYPSIEDDVQKMISQYYSKGVQVGQAISSKLPAPKFITQTYIVPVPIKDLTLTRTRQGITNRHALLLTIHNQLLTIPGVIMDARRPTGNPTREGAAFEDPALPPYDAVIPIKYTFTLSYDLALSGITHLHTIPQEYESTTLVVASGIDLFVSYFAPEKKYDRLSTEFNQWYLMLTVTGLFVAVIVMRRFALKKEAKELYLLK